MKLGIPIGLIKFLHRYSFTIYIVVVLGGLALVILSLTNIINASSATTTEAPDSSIPTFDQATIKKIDSLQPSGTPSQLPNYKGRTNPFSE